MNRCRYRIGGARHSAASCAGSVVSQDNSIVAEWWLSDALPVADGRLLRLQESKDRVGRQ